MFFYYKLNCNKFKSNNVKVKLLLKSLRRLKKLILYKNIKIFEYAINDIDNCKNYKLYFYVNFEKHVHIKSLKNKNVYVKNK